MWKPSFVFFQLTTAKYAGKTTYDVPISKTQSSVVYLYTPTPHALVGGGGVRKSSKWEAQARGQQHAARPAPQLQKRFLRRNLKVKIIESTKGFGLTQIRTQKITLTRTL